VLEEKKFMKTAQVSINEANISKIWCRNQPILLVLCGQGFNKEYKGHYNRYKVLIGGKPIQNVFATEELKNLSYWVQRSQVMAMTCWGTSQRFEAVISLALIFPLNTC